MNKQEEFNKSLELLKKQLYILADKKYKINFVFTEEEKEVIRNSITYLHANNEFVSRFAMKLFLECGITSKTRYSYNEQIIKNNSNLDVKTDESKQVVRDKKIR